MWGGGSAAGHQTLCHMNDSGWDGRPVDIKWWAHGEAWNMEDGPEPKKESPGELRVELKAETMEQKQHTGQEIDSRPTMVQSCEITCAENDEQSVGSMESNELMKTQRIMRNAMVHRAQHLVNMSIVLLDGDGSIFGETQGE